MNRRGVLAAIAGTGVFGPKLARDAAQNLARQKPPPRPQRVYSGPGETGPANSDPEAAPIVDMREARNWARIFQDAAMRAEIESLFFEANRTVHSIDPDIEVMRSFSQMAKITYQRQRNVARAMAQRESQSLRDRVSAIVRRVFGIDPRGLSLSLLD